MQAETLESKVLGAGPIPTQDALALVADARTAIYAAVQKTDGAILKSRTLPPTGHTTPETRLALRDSGTCAHPGCATRWNRCDADHDPPWDEGGLTDIESLRHLCSNEHHPHRHETGVNITRQTDGTWTVDNETLPPRRPPKPARLRTGEERRRCLRVLHRAAGRHDPFAELESFTEVAFTELELFAELESCLVR